MAWQYVEYANYPYLSDWIGKEWRFSVESTEDIASLEETEIELPEGSRKLTIIHGNGVLRPNFYMSPEKAVRPYTLMLSIAKGLIRQHTSSVYQGQIGKYQALQVRRKSLRAGDFNDFKTLAQYASQRLPKLAQEIVLPPADFPEDIPEDEVEQITKYRERCLEVVDWESTQREICQHFYRAFLGYTIAEVDKKDGVVPRKNKFSTDELEELHTLIDLLKH